MRAISPITKIPPFFYSIGRNRQNADFPLRNKLCTDLNCECETNATKYVNGRVKETI